MYTLTKSLDSLVKNVLNESQILKVKNKINDYIELYNQIKHKSPELIAELFQQLLSANIVKNQILQKQISDSIRCGKSCDFCCKQTVRITLDEAFSILRYCTDQNIEINWDYLIEQRFTEHNDHLSMKSKNCSFLTQNGDCKIYDARPMSCRKLFSLDDPIKCKNPKASNPKMFLIPDAEIIASACFSACENGSLAEMLVKAQLLIENRTKTDTINKSETKSI